MAHEPAGALQQVSRIRQRCAVKEPHVYVRSEYIDVAEGRISQAYSRTAVMQKLPDFVPAFSHYLKPLKRESSQFTCMRFHPRIDGGIPLDSAIESQQFRSHRWLSFHSPRNATAGSPAAPPAPQSHIAGRPAPYGVRSLASAVPRTTPSRHESRSRLTTVPSPQRFPTARVGTAG